MMIYSRYKRDLAAARDRLQSFGSQVAKTECGLIEYVEYGQGSPVLMVHGIVGGADHGAAMTQTFFGELVRVIAISRFGYLRSPLPEDTSPSAQADLFASLLDFLGIRQVVLVGTSAGSASSLQFALRYPDRCTALVLWSMAVPPYNVPSRLVQNFLRAFFGSNFLIWAMITYFRSAMLRIMGVPMSVQHQLTPKQSEWLSGLMVQFLPISERINGIMNDICVSNPGMNDISRFEQITVPKLIIHAVDDPMPPFKTAKKISNRLPNTRFIEIKNGGHLLLGHFDEVRAEMMAFIQESAALELRRDPF